MTKEVLNLLKCVATETEWAAARFDKKRMHTDANSMRGVAEKVRAAIAKAERRT